MLLSAFVRTHADRQALSKALKTTSFQEGGTAGCTRPGAAQRFFEYLPAPATADTAAVDSDIGGCAPNAAARGVAAVIRHLAFNEQQGARPLVRIEAIGNELYAAAVTQHNKSVDISVVVRFLAVLGALAAALGGSSFGVAW
jgi:hypothetical protein